MGDAFREPPLREADDTDLRAFSNEPAGMSRRAGPAHAADAGPAKSGSCRRAK
jgi:hypothetical protein